MWHNIKNSVRCGAVGPDTDGVIRKEFCMGAVDRKNVKMLAEGLLLAAIGSSLLFWYQLMALRLELFRHAEEKTSEEV